MNPASFDLASAPLESGITLLEASAGTGKTYTIAGLVLRLLLERRLLINELLVVTFTEAATAELRTRIRKLLVEARAAVQSGVVGEPWLKRYTEASPEKRAEWSQQLQAALESLDEAPVFTLHGFCRRVLWDRAFETGAWFDVELTPEVAPVLREATDAFWRRKCAEVTELEALVTRIAGVSADSLYSLLRFTERAVEVRVLDRAKGRDRAALVRELTDVFAQAKSLWESKREEITRPFGTRGKWGNKPYNREVEMAEHWRRLDQVFAPNGATVAAAGSLRVLSASEMWEHQSRRATTQRVPAHPFYNVCDRWEQLVADYASAVQAEFLVSVRAEIWQLRERDKTLGFDDLLTQLQAALRSPGGAGLSARIRKQYRAALIDEFQDTDSVQFEIFEKLFGQGETPLYLVGDPKQAIYSFRGADVFAYLRAQQRAQRRRTLGENFRSEAPLVAAVNSVFQPPDTQRPFALDEIQFQPVQARGQAETIPLTEEGRRRGGLQVWFWDPPAEFSTKPKQERLIAEAVAAEVVRLLTGPVLIGERRVQPRDVAVLVDNHAQAALLADVLGESRIPSVMQTQESVWRSAEAHELERILVAIAEPGWEAGLRGALTTTLLGITAASVDPQSRDSVLESWCNTFGEHAHTWDTLGFLPMFERFLRVHGVRARLLAQNDGERRLTNLLHLAELLHEVAERRRLGPLGLREWLAERRVADDVVGEEALLRLERDDDAVQLVTVHRSKGLEYPIVFCPFLLRKWELWKEEPTLFHDPQADNALTLDLGTPEKAAHEQRMKAERFAENLRLTYVALTRAKHRGYVVWGMLKGAEHAALSWLLHSGLERNGRSFEELPQICHDYVKQLTAPQRRADLDALVSRAAGDMAGGATASPIEIRELAEPEVRKWLGDPSKLTTLAAREFRGEIERDWSVTSFTGLARGRRDEQPDRDAQVRTPVLVAESDGSALANFRGARAGVCLHELFETLDFEAKKGTLEPSVTAVLRKHGFSSDELAAPVAEMIRRTLTAPLPTGFSLSCIPERDRLVELEFCVPLRRITPEDLARVWARHGALGVAAGREFPRLQFRPVEGFLRGFMDLVFRRDQRFWLVDWKSNWLGPTPADYRSDQLADEMGREQYYWQYHLYLVALDAWLRQRISGYRYEQHFGGVLYLFVRGTGADPQHPELGIFHDRPSVTFVEALRDLLLVTGARTAPSAKPEP